jgi:hypothetical protein
MNLKKLSPIKTLLLAFLLAGCGKSVSGSGQIKTTTSQVSGAASVKFFGIGQLLISQGDSDSLSITTDDNLLPLLGSRLEGEILTLDQKSGEHLKPTKGIEYGPKLKALEALDWSGAGKVAISDLKVPRLVVLAAGAGEIQLTNVQVDDLILDLGGAVQVVAAGQVKNLTVQGSGAGSLDAKSLGAENATVKLSGTGNVTVNATATLDASVSGVGSITYSGTPKVTQSITGVGKIGPG